MNNSIEIRQLKERISLTRVVGHYLNLEKRGAVYIGLCPFHDDHHPSLRVDPAKGLYHCFSCKCGGDVFRFVQEKEGCSFGEALRICTDICHLPMPAQPAATEPPAAPQKKELPVPTVAENEDFRRLLLPFDPGMEELKETYAAFGVGLAPAHVPKVYDFTARRVVFPIRNAAGELVAFAARYQGTIPDKKTPKYLNSATSPLYKKDTVLYGWPEALKEIRQTGLVYLTEGYKDTLAMHAAGFTNTVALCGVNLSAAHIANLCREVQTVCLLLDADEVGRNTVQEVLPLLRKARLHCLDLLPEDGKDPDEMFRRMGREAFAEWVRRHSQSPECRKLEALLAAAYLRWPDTRCLLPDGSTQLYRENISEVLAFEHFFPACTPVPATDAELDEQYALRTDASHSEEVRRSELMQHLFMCYLERRLVERIRIVSKRLLQTSAEMTPERQELLETLAYDRDYLATVTRMFST